MFLFLVGSCEQSRPERKQPEKYQKLEGGWGGGRSASPPVHSLLELTYLERYCWFFSFLFLFVVCCSLFVEKRLEGGGEQGAARPSQ